MEEPTDQKTRKLSDRQRALYAVIALLLVGVAALGISFGVTYNRLVEQRALHADECEHTDHPDESCAKLVDDPIPIPVTTIRI